MAKYVIMPKLSPNMKEGKIVKWLKQEGEEVQEPEPILQIETDKSVIDVETQISGILRKIFVPEGEFVPVTLPIAIIANLEENIDDMVQEALERLESNNKLEKVHLQINKEEELQKEATKTEVKSFERDSESIKISPRAQKKAAELGIDLQLVKNEFQKRLIQSNDVIAFFEKEKMSKTEKVVPKKVPYDGMRKIIGDRLSNSKFSAPHIYFTTSVDMSNILALRNEVKNKTNKNISINDFIIFVVAQALVEHPKLNSSLLDNQIVYFSSINIGIAVGLEEGLIVPVLKEAQTKNLIEISKETAKLIALARDRKLLPEYYQDGTFTISNLGMFEIEEFTAIINPPEAGILAVGSIQKKPVVDDYNQISIKTIMKITLSVDHRIIDGITAANFLNTVKQYLLQPGILLLKSFKF